MDSTDEIIDDNENDNEYHMNNADEILDYVFNDTNQHQQTNILDFDDEYNLSNDQLLDIEIPQITSSNRPLLTSQSNIIPSQSPNYEDNYSNDELIIVDTKPSPTTVETTTEYTAIKTNNGTIRYLSDLTKPAISLDKISIGYGNARLYGLVDANGKIRLPNIIEKAKPIMKKKSIIDRLNHISTRKEQTTSNEEDKEITFKPMKSNEALRAMNNKKCGYDFLTRLNNETLTNVLDRLTNSSSSSKNGSKLNKSALEALENDYNVRLDKLSCPNCKKFQSFIEYHEKRRFCSQCNVKYAKLNITTGEKFLQKNAVHMEKKLEKLKVIENEMYGDLGKLKIDTSLPRIHRVDVTQAETDYDEDDAVPVMGIAMKGKEGEITSDRDGILPQQPKRRFNQTIASNKDQLPISQENKLNKTVFLEKLHPNSGKLRPKYPQEGFSDKLRPCSGKLQPIDPQKISSATDADKKPKRRPVSAIVTTSTTENIPITRKKRPKTATDHSKAEKNQTNKVSVVAGDENSDNKKTLKSMTQMQKKSSKQSSNTAPRNFTNHSSSEDETAKKFKKLIL